MFKNIRRNSKQFISTGRRKSAPIVTPDPTPASTSDSSSKSTRTTFFDLPAELRNVVYKQIAEETKILVPIPSKKAAKTPPPIPSLMLASKQTRQEFIPLLLEHGTIAFQIKDWDFQPLIRLLRSLYSTELKSLRCNGRLRVCIWLERMDDSGPDRLRKWLVFRSQGLDRLALGYGVVWGRYTQIIPTSTQVQKVNVFMQRRMILGQGLNAMGKSPRGTRVFESRRLFRVTWVRSCG